VSSAPLVDWELVIERAGGRPELAQELFQVMLSMLPDHFQIIAETLEARDHERLEIEVHTLRGTLGYSGAKALQDCAKAFDEYLRVGEIDAITINNYHQQLLQLYQQLLAEAKDLLDK
tara:strand:+ start:231 stop:584 length:354 start_codon:yes stop_codon:yes gene_type:complete